MKLGKYVAGCKKRYNSLKIGGTERKRVHRLKRLNKQRLTEDRKQMLYHASGQEFNNLCEYQTQVCFSHGRLKMGYMWIVSVYTDGKLTRRYTAILRTVEDIFWHVQFNYGKLELDGQGQNCFAFCNDDSSLYVHYQN